MIKMGVLIPSQSEIKLWILGLLEWDEYFHRTFFRVPIAHRLHQLILAAFFLLVHLVECACLAQPIHIEALASRVVIVAVGEGLLTTLVPVVWREVVLPERLQLRLVARPVPQVLHGRSDWLIVQGGITPLPGIFLASLFPRFHMFDSRTDPWILLH